MEQHDWTLFFDDCAGDLHPSFKKELSRQLLEKGDQTGIKQFHKYNFSLIVGMKPMNIRKTGTKVLATIEFITPTSWTLDTTISWTPKQDIGELEDIHLGEVTADSIDFNWEDDFPLKAVQAHISPYKKSKAEKNGFGFDVAYYYWSVPDVELEVFFKNEPSTGTIESINELLISFYKSWNQNKKGKEIQIMSELTKIDSHYSIIMDTGLKNTVKTIHELLRLIGELHGALIENVSIK